MGEIKKLQQAVEKFKAREAAGETDRLLFGTHEVGGLKILTTTVPDADANRLRQMGDLLRDKAPNIVAVLATVNGEKFSRKALYTVNLKDYDSTAECFDTIERIIDHLDNTSRESYLTGQSAYSYFTKAETEDDLAESIRTMLLLKKEIKTPVAYHANGKAGMLSRIINPLLGGQIAFCVDRYTEASVMEQIDLRSAKSIVENMKKII